MFSKPHTSVILVQKGKGPTPSNPNGQKNKLNGAGGKVEEIDEDNLHPEETYYNTAIREVIEEFDIKLDRQYLQCFRKEIYQDGVEVHYFVTNEPEAYHKAIQRLKTNDGDYIIPTAVSSVRRHRIKHMDDLVWNVPYLVPMAQEWLNNPSNRWTNL